jgi:hypothetical protein
MKKERYLTTLLAAALGVLLLRLVALGQGTYDAEWNTVDGGGGVSAGNTFAVSGTAGQPDAGTSIGLTYTVRGGFWPGAIAPANEPPMASAGDDQNAYTNALVSLDGSGSSDPDGDLPLTYGWLQTGGPEVTFATNLSVTTFTAPDAPAVLTLTLTVTDSLGLVAPTPGQVVVTVEEYHIYMPLVVRQAESTYILEVHTRQGMPSACLPGDCRRNLSGDSAGTVAFD